MPRPSLDPAAVEGMRDRLAQAALELYRRLGLEGLSFRLLGQEAGVSHTLAYRYFKDKEALLAHMRTLCFRQFHDHVLARERAEGGAMAHVRSVAQAYVDYVREHTADYLLSFSTTQPPPSRYPELLAARRALFEHAVGIVRHHVEAGALHGDPRQIVHGFWVTLHGLMTLHAANQLVHGYSMEELVEPLIERMAGALSPDHASLQAAEASAGRQA